MPDIFDKNQFRDVLKTELEENIVPHILNNMTKMGNEHLRAMAGKKYEIKVKVDEKEQKSKISAPGLKPIEVEEKEHYFKKTFNAMCNPAIFKTYLKSQKIKRITNKYLPDTEE